MTDRQQDIEQIAGIIAEYSAIEPADYAEIRRINAGGWTYEVRYSSHEYPSERSYTLVEGRVLNDTDLRAAWDLAQRWLAGDFREA